MLMVRNNFPMSQKYTSSCIRYLHETDIGSKRNEIKKCGNVNFMRNVIRYTCHKIISRWSNQCGINGWAYSGGENAYTILVGNT
jgi:hypothetical protein